MQSAYCSLSIYLWDFLKCWNVGIFSERPNSLPLCHSWDRRATFDSSTAIFDPFLAVNFPKSDTFKYFGIVWYFGTVHHPRPTWSRYLTLEWFQLLPWFFERLNVIFWRKDSCIHRQALYSVGLACRACVCTTKWLALEMITCCKTAFWNYYLLIFQTASGWRVWCLAGHQKTHLWQVMSLSWFVWLQMRWTFCKSSLLNCWTIVRPPWPRTTADVQSCRWDSTRHWLSLFSSSSLMGI